jgi:hypothetical protein
VTLCHLFHAEAANPVWAALTRRPDEPPAGLAPLLRRMMEPPFGARPGSMAEVVAALDAVRRGGET